MKWSFLFRAILILTSILIIACDVKNESLSSDESPSTSSSANFIQCEGERPSICTHIYKPVCASVDTGIRCVTTPCPGVEFKTYGNACSACADSAVDGFVEGECSSSSDNSSSRPSDTQEE